MIIEREREHVGGAAMRQGKVDSGYGTWVILGQPCGKETKLSIADCRSPTF